MWLCAHGRPSIQRAWAAYGNGFKGNHSPTFSYVHLCSANVPATFMYNVHCMHIAHTRWRCSCKQTNKQTRGATMPQIPFFKYFPYMKQVFACRARSTQRSFCCSSLILFAAFAGKGTYEFRTKCDSSFQLKSLDRMRTFILSLSQKNKLKISHSCL